MVMPRLISVTVSFDDGSSLGLSTTTPDFAAISDALERMVAAYIEAESDDDEFNFEDMEVNHEH